MDADEKFDPSEPSAADFSTNNWPLGADESNSPYFFGSPDAESNILREFGWNFYADQHQNYSTRCFGDPDHQIQVTAAAYFDGNGCFPENSTTAQFQCSPADPAAVADDATASKPSASCSSSGDPSERSAGSAVKSTPEIPNKVSRKKGQKRIRQPRFAFKTKSKVDHLEDGYRWRKYGQKAVKNSPFPRSYYRCTNSKCTVKKRVERWSEEPETVITTYEGQHCHHAAGFLRAYNNNYSQSHAVGIQPAPTILETPHSNVNQILSPAAANNEITSHDQGLLADIVPPTMRN